MGCRGGGWVWALGLSGSCVDVWGSPLITRVPPKIFFGGGLGGVLGFSTWDPSTLGVPRKRPSCSARRGGGFWGRIPHPWDPMWVFLGCYPPPQHPTGLGVPPGGRRTGPPSPPDLGEAPGSFLTCPQIQGKAAARRIRGGGGPHLPSLTLTMFLPLMMVFWVFFFFGGAYSWTSSTWVRSR